MSAYLLYGAEMSPYSVKLRAYLRFKTIDHEWRNRGDYEDEFKQYAKLPIVPLLVSPDGEGIQDSTPVIEKLEALYPEPSITPADARLAFISALIEEYGDEWGNKIMFHFRWHDETDQMSAAYILARSFTPDLDAASVKKNSEMIRAHMTKRGHFVGSSDQTAPLIENYFFDMMKLLEPHLQNRSYLMGGTPCLGDFGLAAQIYEMALDPTLAGHLRARYPNILAWCYRMQDPVSRGDFETWQELQETLEPLLINIAQYFLPWSLANARALKAGQSEFSVELGDQNYIQGPQKYHAKSLIALQKKYQFASEDAEVALLMKSCGIEPYLIATI